MPEGDWGLAPLPMHKSKYPIAVVQALAAAMGYKGAVSYDGMVMRWAVKSDNSPKVLYLSEPMLERLMGTGAGQMLVQRGAGSVEDTTLVSYVKEFADVEGEDVVLRASKGKRPERRFLTGEDIDWD